MARVTANGIEIEYEETGDPADPPLLMVMGIGSQLINWPMPMREGLAERGLRVIVFDNRDVGLSHKLHGVRAPSAEALLAMDRAARREAVPYTLYDMVADAVGLLDALDIDRAHVAGMSMGGMIAQLVAAHHGPRVKSLVSVMSTTGHPDLPQATPEALAALTTPPKSTAKEDVVAQSMAARKVIGSPGFPSSDAYLKEIAERAYERSYYPEGFLRQYAAILATGNFRPDVETITAPTLVIHGPDDPLVRVEGGRDSAAAIKGARLEEVPGMGHDLAPGLVPILVDLMADHILAAERRAG